MHLFQKLTRPTMTRVAIAGVVAFAVGFTGSISPWSAASPASADPIAWPLIHAEVSPGYVRLEGVTVTSENPTINLSVEDELSLDPYLDYEFEIRITDDDDPATVVASPVVDSERYENFAWTFWDAPTESLDEGEIYWLSARLLADSQAGPWSDELRIYVAEPVSPPVAVTPVNNALVEPPVVLTADAGTEEGAEVIFLVETDWEESTGPIVVSSGSSETDEFGVATFEPSLGLSAGEEAAFRWQALVQGEGYSDWSEFEEFRVSSVPGLVTTAEAVQYVESGRRQNRIDVVWGAANDYGKIFAPTTEFVLS